MNRINARRLTSAACLATASLFPAIGLARTGLAAAPEDKFFTEVIDEQFPSMLFTETCGFETWYTLKGTIKYSFHDNDLDITRYSLTRTLNGPSSSLELREAGVDQVRTELSEDGFVETIHVAGHFNHSWVVPGYGPVELNAGSAIIEVTFTWDEITHDFIVTEEVLKEAGPRDRDLTAEDVEALCGWLG